MARSLPTGTVAFLFTDIEGSTRLARSRPEQFPALLERHRALLREAFSAGAEVDTAGDAFFVAFDRVGDAVSAAAAGQRLLASEPWPEGGEIRVRMGLHAGTADVIGDNYVGAEVHRAARICAAAHGRQVLISHAAAGLVDERVTALALRLVGEYRLKDFDAPQALYQLEGDGLATEFPPPRTAEARVVSLPPELTSFVGREQELVELLDMAMEHRMLTLTGAGGSGKTRLAVRLAWALAPRFRGPVVFVPLARTDSTDGAVAVLARSLQLDGAIGTWDDAIDVLRSQNALVVWDNAEHLPGLDERLESVRDGCDRLHSLVTSRHRLGIPGEQLYPVEPLDRESSVRLLVDRARQDQPHYDAAAALDDLRRVAARLDGLPLALELAAARLRIVPAGAMLDLLDRQLDLLADTAGEHLERHRTIRGALQWSYDLLDPRDASLFESMAVFAGPARLEVIGHVARLDDLGVLNGLTRLIDASLIRLQEHDQPRYWMLEPIRQFAGERLRESGHEVERQGRMLDWYADQAAVRVKQNASTVFTFRDERENLLRAYLYSAELDRWEDGLALATTTVPSVFGVSGTTASLMPWLKAAEAHDEHLSTLGRARLALMPIPRHGISEREQAERQAELARLTADSVVLSDALIGLAEACRSEGDLDGADAALDEAATVVDPPSWGRVNVPMFRALVAEDRANRALSDTYWAETETVARAVDDVVDLVRALWYLTTAAIARGEYARAQELADEALGYGGTWESWPASELPIRYIAGVAWVLGGQPVKAGTHLQRALVLFERVGAADRWLELPVLVLSAAAILAGVARPDEAAALYGWAAPDLTEPTFDTLAVGPQRAMVERSLAGHPAAPERQLDRASVLRLALDQVAAVIEAR